MPIPFLPAVIAALTAINGANYWHQQVKPFQTQEEHAQALKEELAESAFVEHWLRKDKKALTANPDFLKFSVSYFKVQHDENDNYILSLGSNSPLLAATNRSALKSECKKIAVILGHEGAHIAQGLTTIYNTLVLLPHDQRTSYKRAVEMDADKKSLEAIVITSSLTHQEKLDALMFDNQQRASLCINEHTKPDQTRLCEGDYSHPPMLRAHCFG